MRIRKVHANQYGLPLPVAPAVLRMLRLLMTQVLHSFARELTLHKCV